MLTRNSSIQPGQFAIVGASRLQPRCQSVGRIREMIGQIGCARRRVIIEAVRVGRLEATAGRVQGLQVFYIQIAVP